VSVAWQEEGEEQEERKEVVEKGEGGD